MDKKLLEATQKLYHEGIEKAQIEVQHLQEEAQTTILNINQKAKEESEAILNQTKIEIEQAKAEVIKELKQTGSQVFNEIKEKIKTILSGSMFPANSQSSSQDIELIKNAVIKSINQWNPHEQNLSLESNTTEFTDFFKNQVNSVLKQGLNLKFEDRINGEFKIEEKDNNFQVAFIDQEFEQFFRSYLKPKTKELL